MTDKKTATKDKPSEIAEGTRSAMVTHPSPVSEDTKLAAQRAVARSIRSYISTLRPS